MHTYGNFNMVKNLETGHMWRLDMCSLRSKLEYMCATESRSGQSKLYVWKIPMKSNVMKESTIHPNRQIVPTAWYM